MMPEGIFYVLEFAGSNKKRLEIYQSAFLLRIL